MKRRTWPCSSRRWALRAGKVVSISVISSGRLPAFDRISRVPSVCFWNALGSKTLTDTDASRHELVFFILFLQIGFEIRQARAYWRFELIGSGQRVGGLETVACDAGDGEFIGTDSSVSIQARGDGGGHSAGGFGKDSFSLGQLLDRRDDLDIRYVLRPASAVADAACRVDAVRGIADCQRTGNCRWPLRLNVIGAGLHSSRDGRTAGGLRAKEAHFPFLDESERDQFLEGLANFRDERAAGHGYHHVVGQPPAKLLGDLKTHGLRAFRIVGTQIYIDEAPVVAVGDLRAETVDMVVVAVDADQLGPINLRVENLCWFEVVRHQNVALEPKPCGLGCDSIGQVAGRGAPDGVETKDLRVRQRDRNDAVLEAERGQADSVVLDVEIAGADALGESGSAEQWRPACGSWRDVVVRNR